MATQGPKVITKYKFYHWNDWQGMAKGWTLKGSNGANWTTLDTQTDVPAWGYQEHRAYEFANTNSYRYYKYFDIYNFGGAQLRIPEIELIASGDTDECPTMTSDTTPSPFVVTESSFWSEMYRGWRAFNDYVHDSEAWMSAGNTGWIQFDFGPPVYFGVLKRYNGSEWVKTSIKTFKDGEWITPRLHYFDGDVWQEIDN
jgi:hypothetical protein